MFEIFEGVVLDIELQKAIKKSKKIGLTLEDLLNEAEKTFSGETLKKNKEIIKEYWNY